MRQRLVSECRNHSQSRPAAGGRDSLVKLLAHKVLFIYFYHTIILAKRPIQIFNRSLDMPFGGVKDSGTGREGTRHSLELFTEEKTHCVKINWKLKDIVLTERNIIFSYPGIEFLKFLSNRHSVPDSVLSFVNLKFSYHMAVSNLWRYLLAKKLQIFDYWQAVMTDPIWWITRECL